MSNKSSTFAPEIGKGIVLRTSAGKHSGLRRGATREEYPAEKHIPQACGEKRVTFTDFGSSSFRFLLVMKPTYLLLWEIVFDVVRMICRRWTHLCNKPNRE